MNAVEIEEAISELADKPFDPENFPFQFLEAFGNKETTIKRLRETGARSTNKSDVEGGVLQRNHIHIAVCAEGQVNATLTALKQSPATAKGRAKFVLATDGLEIEAEELATGDPLACSYSELPYKFGFFLPLAGISTTKEIKNNPIDIKATRHLNKLYVELLRENEDWATEARRADLNQFMARLIFCFFAEDTGIFIGDNLFTATLQQMTDSQSGNSHEVIQELFRAMDTKPDDRKSANLKPFSESFPYVNGGLFTTRNDVPCFSRIARSYLLRAGELNWQEINPDIFGSMIQAVADDDERGELGMHYTSVPNILKVLNPLFLDDLRRQLERAGDSPLKLLNLRKRIAAIRVFDPACGSGNFLVVAYREMREIEFEIIERRGEQTDPKANKTWINLTNFYGIEIKSFAAEIARLALLIAEFQCNVRYIGQKAACFEVLPLHESGRVKTGNALIEDWLDVCPPPEGARVIEQDLAGVTGRLALDASSAPNGETYLCGNPPYVGDKFQTPAHKSDLKLALKSKLPSNAVDYIAGWFWKASEYIQKGGSFAFVSTNSLCQGVQVPAVWPTIFSKNQEIFFAHQSFPWSNNATNNAKVICVIVGVRMRSRGSKYIFSDDHRSEVRNINAYLVDGPDLVIEKHSAPIAFLPPMVAGNIPRDQGNFMLSGNDRIALISKNGEMEAIIRRIVGSKDFINGIERYCLWIDDSQIAIAKRSPDIVERLKRIKHYREHGSERGKLGVGTPHRFERTIVCQNHQLIVPSVSSQRRHYLPVGLLPKDIIISHTAQAIYDAPLYILAVLGSKLHLVWVGLTAGRMKSDYRYSTGVCYNSFPMPLLTENQKAELKRCAEDILLAREAHFPATTADLYDPDHMPDNLRAAHDKNDETLERIYIGRRFKNDTERLEKLFDMYTKMTAQAVADDRPNQRKAKPWKTA